MLIPMLLGTLLLLTVVQVGAATHGTKTDLSPEQKQALTDSQAVIGSTVAEHRLLDQEGRQVLFSGYLGKPLVVSFIYTSCHHTCPIIIKNLQRAVETGHEALGRDSFTVVTVGFDTSVDSPQRMRLYGRQRGIDFNGWDFLSADAATIQALSTDLGFSFRPSAKGFDHLAQTTVIDAEGRVYRQIYGESYEPFVLVEPLKELLYGQRSSNRVSDWINGIRLFCTIYDPASGRYRFDYSIFMSIIIGLLCLGSIAFFVVRTWREDSSPRPPT